MLNDLCHCWYSAKDEKLRGYCVYELTMGEEVKATNACSVNYNVAGAEKFNSDDAVYLGVGRYVSTPLKYLETFDISYVYRSADRIAFSKINGY